MSATVYERILVSSEIAATVKDVLVKWFPSYLREVERQILWDKKQLVTPTNYTSRTGFDVQPGERLPKVIIVCPGLYQAPTHPISNGSYNASYQVAVAIAVADRDEDLAAEQRDMYGAAIRAIMVQHQSLEREDVIGVTWLDESYDDVQVANRLELFKAAALLFAVEVENVVSRWAGPAEPSEQADTYGEVDTTGVIINKVPVDEPV